MVKLTKDKDKEKEMPIDVKLPQNHSIQQQQKSIIKQESHSPIVLNELNNNNKVNFIKNNEINSNNSNNSNSNIPV